MAHLFDIMPPRPKPAPAPTKRQRKNGCGCFLLVVLVVMIGLFAVQLTGSKIPSKSTPTPTPSPTKTNNFELFDGSGGSKLTQNTVLTVRILDASGTDASAESAKKILTDAGFKIEQIGPSANLYEQTIVYYKKDELSQGQKIQTALKDSFQIKIQESENLGSTYDVLVIVGQK